MKKTLYAIAVVVFALCLTAIVKPEVMYMALGATTPQVVVAKVGSTSKSYHVPASWTRVHCPDQAVYYTTDTTAPTATTSSTVLPANQPVYVNNNTNQFFAFLEKGKGPGKCYLETVQNSFTTATVTGAATFESTVAITGQTTTSGYLSGVDAGFNNITATGNLDVSGDATPLSLTFASSTALAGVKFGNMTLNAASPSVATATVLAGMACQCTPETNAADGLTKCAVSSTTLTATGPNGSSGVINYLCVK